MQKHTSVIRTRGRANKRNNGNFVYWAPQRPWSSILARVNVVPIAAGMGLAAMRNIEGRVYMKKRTSERTNERMDDWMSE